MESRPLESRPEPVDSNDPGIVVLGSVNIDLVSRTTRLPRPGETVLGGEYYQAHGGKGANQAVAAARTASQPVRLIAAVGDDSFGRDALAGFQNEGLLCADVQIRSDAPTGVALILVDDNGQNLISVASGANARLSPADVSAVDDTDFQGRVLLACLESPVDTVEAALRRGRAAGMTTILDPAPAESAVDRRTLLEQVDILTPNATEAAQLTGIAVDTSAQAERAARALQSAGCRAVVLTRGASGLLVCQDDVQHIPAYPVDAVDATAAGDAFNGALAARVSQGAALLEACRWAQAAAALSVTHRGAQPSLPDRRAVEAFLARQQPARQ